MSVAAVIVTAIAATFVLVPSPVKAESGLTCSQLIELLIAIDVIPADKVAAARLLCGAASTTTPIPVPIPISPLTLFSPNGGEVWNIGELREIRWTTTDATFPVIIEAVPQTIYCIRAPCLQPGSTFRISNGVTAPQKGSYMWKVGTDYQNLQQAVREGQWRIVVRQLQNSSSNMVTVSDESDKTFTMTTGTSAPFADLKILEQQFFWGEKSWSDGPITLLAGSQHQIAWHSGNIGACAVSSSDGSFYKYGTSGDALITVPSHSVTYRIECTNIGGGYVITSDELVINVGTQLSPSITILSPNGGGYWYRGNTESVAWKTENIPSSNAMTIRLRSTSSGQEYNLASVLNTGAATVGVAMSVPVGSYMLEIKTATTAGSFVDASDSYFKVVDQVVYPSLSVTLPTIGESWKIGETRTIKWADGRGLMGHKYAINAHSPTGQWMGRISDGVLNEGAFTWIVGNLLNSTTTLVPGQYQIYVGDITETYAPSGLSGVFTVAASVTPTEPSATLTVSGYGQAGGKEGIRVPKGTTVTLNWSSQNVDTCSLSNSYDFWALGTSGSKTHIPTQTTTTYTLECFKNGVFALNRVAYVTVDAVTPVQNITVLSPNGGESYKQGDTLTVSWKKTEPSSTMVMMQLLSNDANFVMMDSGAPNTGTYSWQIPADFTPGNAYKVRITDWNTRTATDVSDANFSITRAPISTTCIGKIGDIDGDGQILASDALYVARYLAAAISLSSEQVCRADVNKDGRVDSVDADLILKAAVGSVTLPYVSRTNSASPEQQTASLAERTQEIASNIMYVIGHWYEGYAMPISPDGTKTVGDSLSASVGGLLSNYVYILTNWHKAYAFN